jgi:hypothetical protein
MKSIRNAVGQLDRLEETSICECDELVDRKGCLNMKM